MMPLGWCGAREGVGCEQALPSDCICSAVGTRRGLAHWGSLFPPRIMGFTRAGLPCSQPMRLSHHILGAAGMIHGLWTSAKAFSVC